MIRFHIRGYAGTHDGFWSSMPVGIVVFADNLQTAVNKAEAIVGHKISDFHFKYEAEEVLPMQPKEGRE